MIKPKCEIIFPVVLRKMQLKVCASRFWVLMQITFICNAMEGKMLHAKERYIEKQISLKYFSLYIYRFLGKNIAQKILWALYKQILILYMNSLFVINKAPKEFMLEELQCKG